jgi:hypothetical protein
VFAYRKMFEDGPATIATWMSRPLTGERVG